MPISFKVGAIIGVEAILSRFIKLIRDRVVSLSIKSLAISIVTLFVTITDVNVKVINIIGLIIELIKADESSRVINKILYFYRKLVIITINIKGSILTIILINLV